MKKIVLLGATGSIGKSTLDLVRENEKEFQMVGISGHTNVQKLKEIAKKINVANILYTNVGTCHGMSLPERYVKFLKQCNPDIVLNAISGFAGLRFSVETLKNKIPLALANKESLVSGGEFLMNLSRKNKTPIFPVDSEHSAIWQCLGCCHPASQGENSGSPFHKRKFKTFSKIYLTCSGGPLRSRSSFANVTKAEVLAHPTWNMGQSITVDSATLANKCLEVFEAMHLFGAKREQIEIVIHPQSIVHSLVEFEDSSLMAQLSPPDMRLPIALALENGERKKFNLPRLDMKNLSLQFEAPDRKRFPTLELLDICTKKMQNFPIVFNAANEVARDAFLKDKISFAQIFKVLEQTIKETKLERADSLEAICQIDRDARERAKHFISQGK